MPILRLFYGAKFSVDEDDVSLQPDLSCCTCQEVSLTRHKATLQFESAHDTRKNVLSKARPQTETEYVPSERAENMYPERKPNPVPTPNEIKKTSHYGTQNRH